MSNTEYKGTLREQNENWFTIQLEDYRRGGDNCLRLVDDCLSHFLAKENSEYCSFYFDVIEERKTKIVPGFNIVESKRKQIFPSFIFFKYKNKKLHCETGPASKDTKGIVRWSQSGQLHRLDGPAIMRPDGSEEWLRNGLMHRSDGPAYTDRLGNELYYLNGLQHRIGGPAAIWADGSKQWLQNGLYHRLDGPAIIDRGREEYYVCGVGLSKEEFMSKYSNLCAEDEPAAETREDQWF